MASITKHQENRNNWKVAEQQRAPTVHFHCIKCDYKIQITQRYGPNELCCYVCGRTMQWRPQEYR